MATMTFVEFPWGKAAGKVVEAAEAVLAEWDAHATRDELASRMEDLRRTVEAARALTR